MSLLGTRVSSFAIGFSSAAAAGAYLLRADIQRGHEQLLSQARARVRAEGEPACAEETLTQARSFEERLAKLEGASKAQ